MDVQTAAASFVASVRALGLPEDASTLCVFPALHVYFDGPEAGPFRPEYPENEVSTIRVKDYHTSTPDDRMFLNFFNEVHRHAGGTYLVTATAELTFRGYPKITRIPPNVGEIFYDVKACNVSNCRSFSLLHTMNQFTSLESFKFDECPGIRSPSGLTLSTQRLQYVYFMKCNLQVTAEDNWDAFMQTIARASGTEPQAFHLRITECNSLTRLPSSISHLKVNGQNGVNITIDDNAAFTDLPAELEDLLQARMTIAIVNCPGLTSIPTGLGGTMGAGDFGISLWNQPHLTAQLLNAGLKISAEAEAGRVAVLYDLDSLRPYFMLRAQHELELDENEWEM